MLKINYIAETEIGSEVLIQLNRKELECKGSCLIEFILVSFLNFINASPTTSSTRNKIDKSDRMEMRHIKIDITKGEEEEAIKMKQGIKIGNYGVRMENPEISK